MFAITPVEIFSDTSLTPAEFRVLGSLFSFRSNSDDWKVWPSRQKIAQRAGITALDHVSHILKRLEDSGWISRERRRGSSIIHLSPDGRFRPEHPCSALDLSTCAQIDQIPKEQTHISPPPPPSAPVTDTTLDQERQRQREEQQEREAQRDQERREREREQRQARHQRREERRIARREERQATAAGSRQEAVQRVLDAFQAHCGVTYPSNGAIATRVASAIERHGESTLIRVIRHRGQTFRFPLALLRDDLVESISAEIERPAPEPGHQEERQQERRIYGVPLSLIEREARPGETLEDAALRIYEQRRNSTLRA